MLWANTLFNTKIKLVAVLLVTAFSVLSPLLAMETAYAADATWKDNKTLSYSGTDFTGPGTIIGSNDTVFSSDSGTCGTRIVFSSNYKTATSAKLQTGGYADAVQHQCGSWSSGKTISVQKMPQDIANGGTATGKDTDGDGVPDSKDKCSDTKKGDKVGSDGCADGQTKDGEAQPQCDAGSWSFMVCPFITSTQEVLQKLFGMIADLSYFQPLPIGTPKKTADWSIYYGWSTFLAFANIAAVIGFLIIIFSQATSMGLSSYGVKKLLPKMAMVMILMNVSYYLCAIAIDISNIIGASINDVFNYIYTQVTNKLDPTLVNGGIGSGAVAGWFGGIAALAIIVAFFLVPVLITLLVIFGVLAARIAILTLLVIIAPLAFAAWILPNTEKYFKKWWSLFFDMLAIYPALMAVYGGATLAANILLLNSQSGSTLNNILPFVALLVQVLPLLAIPFIIKATSGSLGKIAGMVESKSRKPAEWVGGKAKSYGKFGAIAAGRGIASKMPGDPENPGRFRRGAARVRSGYKGVRAFDKAVDTTLDARKRGREEDISERAAEIGVSAGIAGKALSGVGGSRYREIVAAQTEKAFNERVQSIRSDFDTHGTSRDDVAAKLRQALQAGDRATADDRAMAAAAIGQLTQAGGARGRELLEQTLTEAGPVTDQTTRTAVNNAIYRDNYGSLIGKTGSVAKGGFNSDTNQFEVSGGLSALSPDQLASQDVHELAKHKETIGAATARAILDNPALMSKLSNAAESRAIFEERARGVSGTAPSNPGTPDDSGQPPIPGL